MAKNIKKENKIKPVYMTISEANAHNAMTPNNAFMIGIGTEDSPEFIYPEELELATVTASKKESDYKQAEKEASTFRNRSLVGHIGAGLGLNLGDKSLQNIATTAIGAPLIATNPATTTLIKPLIKGVGHIGKVLLDPTKALTGVGQAAATTADIYGTVQGLRQIPGAINNIKQGNGTGMDYFNLVTGAMGPFGTFNTIKGIKNINSFKFPLFDYNAHNAYKTNTQIANTQIANHNYKIAKTNVPQSVTESFDNNSYAYNYLLNSNNYLTVKDINKLRYFTSKSISKYNPAIQKDILSDPKLLDNLAAGYRAFGDSRSIKDHINVIIRQRFKGIRNSPKLIEDIYFNDPKRHQSITRIVKPLEERADEINALRISKLRPSLQQIVKVAPNYLDEIEEYANLGLDDETIAKKILEQRFTFYRGMATNNNINPQNLIQIPINSSAGRADIQIFGQLSENEDVGYLSNSLETAIAYAYPELSQSPNKIVGLIKRKPETFDFTGTPLDWIKNNTLDKLNIKKAISTQNIESDFLKDFKNNLEKYGINNLNFKNPKTKRFLQELYDRVDNSTLTDNYFSHFLLKGTKGEFYKDLYIDKLYNIPYVSALRDISPLEKIFNTKLNKQAITRFHHGVSSPKTSKNKYGGDNKFKFEEMKQNKVFKLNGGMAVPLDDKKRLFYLSGAKHEQGGIDVTPELEAEGGEVIKVNPKSIKVVTAQKIMGSKSPAELVVNASPTGEQDKIFNKVFKYQEKFKDIHGLNDDGTKNKKVKQKLGGQMKKATLGKYYRNKSIYTDATHQRFQDWNKSKEVSDANLAENANRIAAFNEVAALKKTRTPFSEIEDAYNNNVGDFYGEKFDRNTGYDASSLTYGDISTDFINQQKKLGYNLSEDEMTQKYQDYIINRSKAVSNYLGDLYDSKRVQRRMNKYNKYAEKHNPYAKTEFRTTGVFDVKAEDNRKSYYALGFGDRSKIGLFSSPKFSYDNVLGHELAHSRQLFKGTYDPNIDGASTNHIHRQAKRLLKGDYIFGSGENADHDRSYHERYADLMGMRTDMRNLLGVDGISRRYRRSDVRKYLQTNHGKANRFLAGNNYNIGRTKRALNKVYELGGESPYSPTGDKVKAKFGTKKITKGRFIIAPPTIEIENPFKKTTPSGVKIITTPPGLKTTPSGTKYSPKVKYVKPERKRNENNLNLSPEDWIIAGSNLAGSIINLTSRLSSPQKALKYNNPTPLVAVKNKTKVNINPELQELENAISEYKDTINKNTSSSQVSLNRLRNINLEKLNRINKLYGEKENKETALINENNRNLQNIINSNINQQNIINQKNLENEIQAINANRLQRADAITDFVQNIAGTAGNIVSNIEQRRQFDKNLAATIMGYENIDAEEKYKMIQKLTERNKRNKKE